MWNDARRALRATMTFGVRQSEKSKVRRVPVFDVTGAKEQSLEQMIEDWKRAALGTSKGQQLEHEHVRFLSVGQQGGPASPFDSKGVLHAQSRGLLSMWLAVPGARAPIAFFKERITHGRLSLSGRIKQRAMRKGGLLKERVAC